MKRILLIHWNASEGAEKLMLLQDAGYDASLFTGGPPASLRDVGVAAFVIDLTRIPSQGQAFAVSLRQQKENRLIPIIFAGGSVEKVEKIRQLLPDAFYCSWDEVPAVVEAADRNPPKNPVVPGTFESYSGAPLVQKLGIRAKSRVCLLNAPQDFERTLGSLPDHASLAYDCEAPADVVLLFAQNLATLEKDFPEAAGALSKGSKLWLLWPKQTARLATDLKHDTVQRFGLNAGFMDYKICSVDETWSGLCFTLKKGSS